MTITECARYLALHDRYLILSHQRPDGETLGSGAALCSALRRAGKTAFCIPNPETTGTYAAFVAPFDAPEDYSPSVTVAVDVADAQLLPVWVSASPSLCIDHHPSNTGYAAELLLDASRAACGELVLDVIRALGGGVTKDEADLLYIAVSTDTGCFQYGNTNAHALRAAAELLELGAENQTLNVALFRTLSPARMKLEGMILSSLQFFRGGEISVACITREMMEQSGATEDDCEDLAGIAGKAAGNRISVTVRQLEAEKCKVSMRSKAEIDSSAICAVFGGGGHRMASGCTLSCTPEETVRRVVAAIEERWPV